MEKRASTGNTKWQVNGLVFYLTVACFMEVILWLIHFLNYTHPRAILYELIFPIIGRERSQNTQDIRRKPSSMFF